jgi:hypothetical protein
MKKAFTALFIAALSSAVFAECSPSAAGVLDTTLTFDISIDYAKAWINRVPQSDGEKYTVFDGYIFLSRSSRVGNWLEATYNANRDCWNTPGIASAGWFV